MPPPQFSIFLKTEKVEFTLNIEEKWWRHICLASHFLTISRQGCDFLKITFKISINLLKFISSPITIYDL